MKYNYKYQDIVNALKFVGVQSGDTVFTHSNLGYFGMMQDASSAENINSAFYNAFFEVLGDDGTLVVPTFSYSFCRNKDFDVNNTPGDCGMFSEYIREKSGAIRSYDANFSVAAIGRQALNYTKNVPEHSFGENSFWERLRKNDGRICNLNFDVGSTYVHYIEKALNVKYRYDKPFKGKVIDGEKIFEATYYHYVRDLEKPEDEPNFCRLTEEYKKTGQVKSANLGKGSILAYNSSQLLDFVKDKLVTRPRFLLMKE